MRELGKKFLPDLCGRRKMLVLAFPQHSVLTQLRTHSSEHQFMTQILGACE